MVIDSSKFADARRASGMTLESAASACGITRQTYQIREKKAGDFHLSELVNLKKAMNQSGQKLLQDAIYDLFFLGL